MRTCATRRSLLFARAREPLKPARDAQYLKRCPRWVSAHRATHQQTDQGPGSGEQPRIGGWILAQMQGGRVCAPYAGCLDKTRVPQQSAAVWARNRLDCARTIPTRTGRLAAGRPEPPANSVLPGRGRATKRRESLTQSRAHGVRQRPYRSTCRCPWVEGGGSGSRGMSAEQVALVPQCEECLASNDPLTSHPWRLAVGETLVGRSLFRHVDYFGGPGARRRWGETGGL
jgi:hypothetical protein